MDLRAAADGIAQAHLAVLLLGTLAIYCFAVVLASLGLAVEKASPLALGRVDRGRESHRPCLSGGLARQEVILGSATLCAVILLASIGIVGIVAFRVPRPASMNLL